jgi:murein DD-endopeptidase MepM/ murein hydrolase activator NlpD
VPARRLSGRHRRKKSLRPHLNAPTAIGVAALAVAAVGGISVPDATGRASTAFAAASVATPVETERAYAAIGRVLATDTASEAERSTLLERARLARAEQARQDALARRAAEARAAAQRAAVQRARAAAAARASRARALANRWVLPTNGYRLTGRFGASGSRWASGHTGLDFAAPTGRRVVAMRAGLVTAAGWDGPYGNKVEITHADGTQTWYAHLSAITVRRGAVTTGQKIGEIGSTGNSSGPHVHVEVRIDDRPVDPMRFLARKGVRA